MKMLMVFLSVVLVESNRTTYPKSTNWFPLQLNWNWMTSFQASGVHQLDNINSAISKESCTNAMDNNNKRKTSNATELSMCILNVLSMNIQYTTPKITPQVRIQCVTDKHNWTFDVPISFTWWVLLLIR